MIPRGRSDAPPPLRSPSEPPLARSQARPISSFPPAPGAPRREVKRRVLIVDKDPQVRRSLARLLMDRGLDPITAEDSAAAVALLATTAVDVVFADLGLPEVSGLELIQRVKKAHPDVEIVVMAGYADVEAIPAALRAGAYAFVNKPPVVEDEIANAAHRAAEKRELARRARALEERAEGRERLGEIIGQSSGIVEARRLAAAAANVGSPVLIVGESGSGKEHFARFIHRQAGRHQGPFTMVDCGAISAELVELELFGDGAGGVERSGLLDRSERGVVLLDAVGELSPAAQARLSQALTRGAPTSVRVIAAALPDLRERVAAGRFREDLYYKLAVISIHLPPLRRRREDIPLLAYSFLREHAGRGDRDVKRISVEALRELRAREWPGNVRELSSAVERAVIFARGETIFPADLAPPSEPSSPAEAKRSSAAALSSELSYPEAKERVVDAFERDYIERLLEAADGNMSEAARRAGMDRSNFRRLVRKVEATRERAAKQSRKA